MKKFLIGFIFGITLNMLPSNAQTEFDIYSKLIEIQNNTENILNKFNIILKRCK